MCRIRKTLGDMSPFYPMEVMERARKLERQGRPIIHLEVGEPDFPTPNCITEAAIKALREEKTHYTASVGLLHACTAPGINFGSNAEGYIRFSYTTSIENISKGLDRIEQYLKGS